MALIAFCPPLQFVGKAGFLCNAANYLLSVLLPVHVDVPLGAFRGVFDATGPDGCTRSSTLRKIQSPWLRAQSLYCLIQIFLLSLYV